MKRAALVTTHHFMTINVADRRAQARLQGPFVAQVRITSGHCRFTEGIVEDLCVRAVRIRVARSAVQVGDLWLALVRMSAATEVQAPRVVVRGRVVRVDERGDASIAVVVQISQRRWMFAPERAAGRPTSPTKVRTSPHQSSSPRRTSRREARGQINPSIHHNT